MKILSENISFYVAKMWDEREGIWIIDGQMKLISKREK